MRAEEVSAVRKFRKKGDEKMAACGCKGTKKAATKKAPAKKKAAKKKAAKKR